MKRTDVEKLEKLIGQVAGLRHEIGALAKKSPNDAVNAFKLTFVNQVLVAANAFLGKKYKPLEAFIKFDDEAAPSNSDVTFILTQYAEALDLMRSDNVVREYGDWYYKVDDDEEGIRTSPPGSLARKG